jgi:hypothetical protein
MFLAKHTTSFSSNRAFIGTRSMMGFGVWAVVDNIANITIKSTFLNIGPPV